MQHLPEEVQPLRGEKEVLPVEAPAEGELPVLPPGATLGADGLRRPGKKGLAHRPAPGEAGGEGQGEACAQVPGIPPAEDRDVPAADLPALGIEAPDAALVAGDLIAELGGAEGRSRPAD